jgi:hypothetical protein
LSEERQVTDRDNITWSCVQAYAGLTESRRAEAEAVLAADQVVPVVCTPRGGAQSVRIDLPSSWREKLSDARLLAAIERARST